MLIITLVNAFLMLAICFVLVYAESIVSGLFLALFAITFNIGYFSLDNGIRKPLAEKQEKLVIAATYRMDYHKNLTEKSKTITNQYVKQNIDEILKQVDLQYKNKFVEITVPEDFFAGSRQKEYEETIGLLRASGFSSITPIREKCKFLFLGCEKTSMIYIY